MADVKSIVDQKIQGKKVMMFSKTTCGFCSMAKALFKKFLEDGTLSSDDYEIMEIDGNPKCAAIQDYLAEVTGGRTVPRVFVNQKFVGGCDEVKTLDRNGKLVELIKA